MARLDNKQRQQIIVERSQDNGFKQSWLNLLVPQFSICKTKMIILLHVNIVKIKGKNAYKEPTMMFGR